MIGKLDQQTAFSNAHMDAGSWNNAGAIAEQISIPGQTSSTPSEPFLRETGLSRRNPDQNSIRQVNRIFEEKTARFSVCYRCPFDILQSYHLPPYPTWAQMARTKGRNQIA